MADPLLTEPPPPPPPSTNPNHSNEFNSLPVPPLDPLFLSSQNHHSSSSDDLDFVLDDNCDFDLSLDDLDDLYFPSESDSIFLPDSHFGNSPSDVDPAACFSHADDSLYDFKVSGTASPESGSSGISGNHAVLDVDTYLNYSSSPQNSGNHSSNSGSKGCDPVSSQASGDFGSGVLSGNAPSPDSGHLVVNQKLKLEEVSKLSLSKRKKESEETNSESRSSKYRKSLMVNENSNENMNEEEIKKKARLMRNRESAQLSRQRKKHYVEELEEKVKAMLSTIAELNGKISYLMAENGSLRQQLGGGNAMPPAHPHMGVYPPPPMAPMPYAWMPCGTPYMVKPQGSQTPLVPIPRLKPQQISSPAKAKKSDGSKNSSRIKKVASVSFLGLLFFVLLFGGLVPLVDVNYGGTRDGVSVGYFSNRFYDRHGGRVLTVNGNLSGSHHDVGIGFSNGKFDIGNRIHCEKDVNKKERGSQPSPGSDKFVHLGNASEPLVASLYVPRNDKLVKIDGNLIIHSVLASEKAVASQEASRESSKVNKRETGLAIQKALAIPDRGNGGRHPHVYRNPAERQKAISAGSADALKDHMKSTAADGKLQQWFREGLAGPLLSSGMCTEVFQFDVSPASAPGAIVTASPVTNISVEHRENATHVNRGKNRRFLHGLPVPLTASTLNITREHVERNSQKSSFQGNKSASSMVVSVLVDPREAGDGDVDSTITPKSLSRIFVVVLIDSVKYVTYSCVLPRFAPHLVTT